VSIVLERALAFEGEVTTVEGIPIPRAKATFRKILQSIWYQINNGQEIYVIGAIQADQTVRGGTGWGAEFAKLCNKPLFVFDQDRNGWFTWDGEASTWVAQHGDEQPVIQHIHFTGTGTRLLTPAARTAITDLFTRSFK
jgi:hypothetical protein